MAAAACTARAGAGGKSCTAGVGRGCDFMWLAAALAALLAVEVLPQHTQALSSAPPWAADTARRLSHSAVPCDALKNMPVVVAPDATADEHAAAAELALWLGKVSGGSPLRIIAAHRASSEAGAPHFAVGAAAATVAGVGITAAELAALGPGGFVIRGRWRGAIGLSGAPNTTTGTFFAAVQIAHMLGVRFFTANATNIPACAPVSKQAIMLPPLNLSFRPAFEYRSVDGWAAEWDPLHTKRSHLTDMHRDGLYATPPGIVHTSYNFFSGARTGRGPSSELFKTHNEWFWPHNDSSVYGQLCWSNQSMIEAVIGSVRVFLGEQPNATLISVSQNDNMNQCLDPAERKITEEEQSDIGPILRAVNQIADAIRDDHPHVAVSTLAYDYGEQPPVVTKPRENVIIRLCTGSMNFAQPLTHPSNARFRGIIEGWRYKANATRLYVWNYVVDSANTVQTYPDYEVLAQNIQFFARLGVRGLYEEGPGVGSIKNGNPEGPGAGTDMEELKDYLMASMMWDPTQNAAEVMNEFLVGYYSAAAAPHVRTFIEKITSASQRSGAMLPMHTGAPWLWKSTGQPAFLNQSHFTEVLACNAAFRAAFDAVRTSVNHSGTPADTSTLTARLRKAYMAVLLPSLWRWDELRSFAESHQIAWPLPDTKVQAFQDFARTFNETKTAGLYYNNYYAIPKPCVYGCALEWLRQCLFTAQCGVTGHVVPTAASSNQNSSSLQPQAKKFGIGSYMPFDPDTPLSTQVAQNAKAFELVGKGGWLTFIIPAGNITAQDGPQDLPGTYTAPAGDQINWTAALEDAYERGLNVIVRLEPEYGVNDHANPPHLRNLADEGSDFLSFKEVAKTYARLASSLLLPPDGQPLHVQFANELNLAWDCNCSSATVRGGHECVSAARIARESSAYMRDVLAALRPIPGLKLAHSPIAPIGPVGRACCANASSCPTAVSLNNVEFLRLLVAAEPNLYRDVDWFASHAYPCSGAGCGLDASVPCGMLRGHVLESGCPSTATKHWLCRSQRAGGSYRWRSQRLGGVRTAWLRATVPPLLLRRTSSCGCPILRYLQSLRSRLRTFRGRSRVSHG